MNGLAWFAQQVPSEGFSDIGEGRVGEKEIPHSDQWIRSEDDRRVNYRPDQFNRKQVLKGKNRRTETTVMIEEIYQSDECEINKEMHNATYENGRFVYAYPPAFQNSRSVNKMIAVRRIETKQRSWHIDFKFTIKPATGDSFAAFDVTIDYEVTASMVIQNIVDEVKRQFNLNTNVKTYEVSLIMNYYVAKSGVVMKINKPWCFKRVDNDDFLEMLNVPKSQIPTTYGDDCAKDAPLTFKGVRLREHQDLFIHGSFVTNTNSGYLGRGGEFYDTPSKMYPDDGQSFFYLETSLDGYHKIELPYEKFIVELTFIIDSDQYTGS
jgi:hypothetical protein